MTNTYEPNEHAGEHEEAASSEHANVSEPPSDYEFADEVGATADVDHTEDGMSLPAEEQVPRRSPVLPVIAAVGGVLILGAVAWWQFGGSSPAPQFVNTSLPSAPPAAANAPMPHAPSAPVSANADVPSLPVAPKVAMAQPATADASSSPALPSADNVRGGAPAATALPMAPVPTPIPSATMSPSVAPSPVPPPAPAPAANIPPTPVVAAPVAISSNADQRVGELTERMDSLQKELDQANQKLSQVASMAAAAANPAPSTTSPAAAEMQGRIDKLEQELADMRQTSPMPSPSLRSADVSREPVISSSAPHEHKHKAPVHKASRKPVRKPDQNAKPGKKWVLRAASPGQAWVATSANASDLKPLKVGDTLAGIGSVMAIQQDGDHWVVQGTQGTIQ